MIQAEKMQETIWPDNPFTRKKYGKDPVGLHGWWGGPLVS
jgi:hypothetical protein